MSSAEKLRSPKKVLTVCVFFEAFGNMNEKLKALLCYFHKAL